MTLEQLKLQLRLLSERSKPRYYCPTCGKLDPFPLIVRDGLRHSPCPMMFMGSSNTAEYPVYDNQKYPEPSEYDAVLQAVLKYLDESK